MNKAFTKEDDAVDLGLPDEPWPLPAGAVNYMTPRGARALRLELAERTAAAAAEPDAARKREIQRRIRAIERRFREGEVVDPTQHPAGRAVFGTRVRVRDASDVEQAYEIVGVDEAAPAQGRVSWQSAIARALVGRTAGDVVTVRAPGGERELEIVAVEPLDDGP